MARLPNSDQAIVDLRKIESYCLNPEHPRGRHKARLFREALGLISADAAWLRQMLLDALQSAEATEFVTDAFGSRCRVDVPISRHGKTAVVRTI
jgi:hypothetical protein